MSNTEYKRFKMEQKKNLNAPMTTCPKCHNFKHVTWDEYENAWFCFDCAKVLIIQREKNYNPSLRDSV